jgi:DNA polymerase epsilon subunit 2
MSRQLQNKVGLAFKREGFVLHGSSTLGYILDEMKDHHDQSDFLARLLAAIDRKALKQNFVDLAAAERAVGIITMDVSAKVEEESLKVISAFDCPRHRYHESRKTFILEPGKPSLHGTAHDQAEMFRHRFELIRQRVMRNPVFAQEKLTTVKSLLGATGQKYVFGMLTLNSLGDLILEDLNNSVTIDLTHAEIYEGLYTDHCMVLADGELKGGKFHVNVLSMPAYEDAHTTLSTFANVDMFGAEPDSALQSEIELYQNNAEHVMLVVLSDVWIDRPSCMAKLETLFEGYQDIVPTAFVFMGTYTSHAFAQTAEDASKLQALFSGLARLILKFRTLALGSRWIFSRGPSDGGGPYVYPQFELPDFFVSTLKQKLPNVTFTTNPFRIRWCNVKMVFFRENLISKMRRHTLFPKQDLKKSPPEVLVKTLMEQSHLCPMPQAVCPLYWNYDQAMTLYPIPDLAVLGDSYEQYVVREKDYLACNPGSFAADCSFIVVRPSTMEVEESNIPDGTEMEMMDGEEGEPMIEPVAKTVENEEEEVQLVADEIGIDLEEMEEIDEENEEALPSQDDVVEDIDDEDEEDDDQNDKGEDGPENFEVPKTQLVPDDQEADVYVEGTQLMDVSE